MSPPSVLAFALPVAVGLAFGTLLQKSRNRFRETWDAQGLWEGYLDD